MKALRKCLSTNTYTLKEICSDGSPSVIPRPAKYSPDDKYAKYRRQAKEQQHG